MKDIIKYFWPEIMYSYTKVRYDYTKTGINFIDEQNYWGLRLD